VVDLPRPKTVIRDLGAPFQDVSSAGECHVHVFLVINTGLVVTLLRKGTTVMVIHSIIVLRLDLFVILALFRVSCFVTFGRRTLVVYIGLERRPVEDPKPVTCVVVTSTN
jgi:hypothetical protein